MVRRTRRNRVGRRADRGDRAATAGVGWDGSGAARSLRPCALAAGRIGGDNRGGLRQRRPGRDCRVGRRGDARCRPDPPAVDQRLARERGDCGSVFPRAQAARPVAVAGAARSPAGGRCGVRRTGGAGIHPADRCRSADRAKLHRCRARPDRTGAGARAADVSPAGGGGGLRAVAMAGERSGAELPDELCCRPRHRGAAQQRAGARVSRPARRAMVDAALARRCHAARDRAGDRDRVDADRPVPLPPCGDVRGAGQYGGHSAGHIRVDAADRARTRVRPCGSGRSGLVAGGPFARPAARHCASHGEPARCGQAGTAYGWAALLPVRRRRVMAGASSRLPSLSFSPLLRRGPTSSSRGMGATWRSSRMARC